jgi:CheY-like chemotaxis protein
MGESNEADGRAPDEVICILVVDDVPDSAAALAILLEMRGHETHVAHDGLRAVELAEWLRPGLIFMDIAMPGLDGFEAASRIRNRPWGEDIVICALSAYDSSAVLARSHRQFNFALTKPPHLRDVEAILAEVAPRRCRDRGNTSLASRGWNSLR